MTLRTSWLCSLFLALAACGVDVESAPRASPAVSLTATPVVAPLDPFLLCTWHGLPVPNQNIGVTGHGYLGEQRGFRIWYGDYKASAGYLEYKIEVIWSLPGCSGTIYYLRFPVTGLNDHAEIEVRGGAGALKARLVADKGSLPVLYNQASLALPTSKRGPFVITSAMVGGASGMADTIAFTLLDAQVLSHLPYPVFYDGATPTAGAQADAVAAAHQDLIGDNELLYSLFRFHIALEAMTSADRQASSDAIDAANDLTGLIHGDPLWEEHHHIDHSAAVGPADVGISYGGFFNGHRNFIAQVERHLPDYPPVSAFGRVPIWDSATTIPAEFAIGVDPARDPLGLGTTDGDLSGGLDMETAYKAANICANFATSLSSSATVAERLADEEVALFNDVNGWHGSVHLSVAGDMGPFETSASTPIFYAWHGLVDMIWNNWQLCEAAYHPNRYSWDAL